MSDKLVNQQAHELAIETSNHMVNRINQLERDRNTLRAELETAVMHLESILGQHTEDSDTLTAADRWLRSRQS